MSGTVALLGFFGWSWVAYQASDEARAALQSDERVGVRRREGYWSFSPRAGSCSQAVGLLFFPGALVEPAAYAPLARAVVQKGYAVLLIELPRRGMFGGADGGEVVGPGSQGLCLSAPRIHATSVSLT